MAKTPVRTPSKRLTRSAAGSADPVLQPLFENIEILNGARGNGLDRAVLMRDLLDLGYITWNKGAGGRYNPGLPGTGVVPGDGTIEAPHAPLGVTASGGFSMILIDWDAPTYQGHAYTEILRADTDNFSQAVTLATTSANLYGDSVGTGKVYYYWVRFVNKLDVRGPVQSTNGVKGETQADIGEILDKLRGQIDESFMTPAYNSKIQDISDLTNLLQQEVKDIEGEVISSSDRVDLLEASADILAEATMEAAAGVDQEGITRRKAEAQIKLEQKVIITDLGVQAKQILTISARVDDNYSQIQETKNAVVNLDSETKQAIESITQKISTQDSVISGNIASINSLNTTIVQVGNETTQNKSDILVLTGTVERQQSEINNNKASIETTNTTVAQINEKTNENTGNIQTLTETATRQQSEIDNNKATITSQGQTIVTVSGVANSAQAAANAAQSEADQAKADAAAAAGIANGKGKVLIQSSAPSSADRLPQNLWIDTTGGANTPKRWSGSAWEAVTDKAAIDAANAAAAAKAAADKAQQDANDNAQKIESVSETLTQLSATVGQNTASITEQSQTIVTVKNTADSALTNAATAQGTANTANANASAAKDAANAAQNKANQNAQEISVMSQQMTTITSDLNGTKSQVTQNSQTIATINADGTSAYKAQWGVKASVGDIESGIGLTAKQNPDGSTTTQCTVIAQQFSVGYVGPGGDPVYPFIIDPTYGVVIDTARIKAAAIQDLVAGEVVADNIKAGATIKAPFIEGGRIAIGSRFSVDENGNMRASDAFMDNAIVYGTVYATDGDFKGTVYAKNMVGNVMNFSRISGPSSGYWYKSTITSSNPRFPFRKVATLKLPAASASRMIKISNFNVGVGATQTSAGTAWAGKVQARTSGGSVLRQWSITLNTSTGYPTDKLAGRKVAISRDRSIRILDGITLPANQTNIEFWVTVDQGSTSGNSSLDIIAALGNNEVNPESIDNTYGWFIDIEYVRMDGGEATMS